MLMSQRVSLVAIAIIAAVVTFHGLSRRSSTSETKPFLATVTPSHSLIYSTDPRDPWNRIFSHLFTRKVRFRTTADLAGRGPYITLDQPGFVGRLRVTRHTRK